MFIPILGNASNNAYIVNREYYKEKGVRPKSLLASFVQWFQDHFILEEL